MRSTAKGVGGAAVLAATCMGAMAADAPTAVITATGHALAVCTVGQWTKASGAGTFSGGSNGVLTYSESDLVDANSMSVLNASKAVEVRIPVLCNTAMTWSLEGAKGALRNDTTPTAPTGFSSQWLYHLDAAPKTAGGANVGYLNFAYDSEGFPITGVTSLLNTGLSLTVSYFSLKFTPTAAVQRMTAGSYSEVFTFTVTPGL